MQHATAFTYACPIVPSGGAGRGGPGGGPDPSPDLCICAIRANPMSFFAGRPEVGGVDTSLASKFKLFSSGYAILNNVISNTETITAVQFHHIC